MFNVIGNDNIIYSKVQVCRSRGRETVWHGIQDAWRSAAESKFEIAKRDTENLCDYSKMSTVLFFIFHDERDHEGK
jgi:hypothetical protein